MRGQSAPELPPPPSPSRKPPPVKTHSQCSNLLGCQTPADQGGIDDLLALTRVFGTLLTSPKKRSQMISPTMNCVSLYLPSMLCHSGSVIDGVKYRDKCVVASSRQQAICVQVHLLIIEYQTGIVFCISLVIAPLGMR